MAKNPLWTTERFLLHSPSAKTPKSATNPKNLEVHIPITTDFPLIIG